VIISHTLVCSKRQLLTLQNCKRDAPPVHISAIPTVFRVDEITASEELCLVLQAVEFCRPHIVLPH